MTLGCYQYTMVREFSGSDEKGPLGLRLAFNGCELHKLLVVIDQ